MPAMPPRPARADGASPTDPARPPAPARFGDLLRAAAGGQVPPEVGPRVLWRRLAAQYGARNIAVAVGVVALVLAAFALPTSRDGDPFDGPGAAVDIILKLGAVVALAYVALAALKRYTGSATRRRGGLLEVLDSATLAPNRSVYVVRAGGKRLVLGVTQTQITALAELPDGATDLLDAVDAPGDDGGG